MRGSLIISFDDIDGFGGDYLDIVVNSVLRKRIYTNSSSLYSCPLYVGDVVNLQFNDLSPSTDLNFDVYRRDYTTDDQGGDNGIKTTQVSSGVTNTGVTFTVSTLNISYDFEYRLDLESVIFESHLLTESSQPILTENNDNLDRE